MYKDDFKLASKSLYFHKVPFAKVKLMCHEEHLPFHIKFKKSFSGSLIEERLIKGTPQRKNKQKVKEFPPLKSDSTRFLLSDKKN